MSREDASKLFKYGVDALLQAKSNTDSPDYGSLLIEAQQWLERAVDRLEKDDPDYNVYSQICASAHAGCLLLVDFSAGIDTYLSSSRLFEVPANVPPRNLDVHPIDPNVDGTALDAFWRELYQLRDRFAYAAHTELVSSRTFATHVVSFNQAISCSSGDADLECLWYTYRAIVLYLRMEQHNPDEVALCIMSMNKAIRLRETGHSPSGDTNPILLQTLPEYQCDPSTFKKRLFWLNYLATVYIHRHTSIFREYLDLYRSSSDSGHLDDAIAEAREALSWGRDTGLLPDLRFKLLLALGQALHERYWQNGALEDLEDSAECLREALVHEAAPTDRLLFCRQRLSTITADLAKELAEVSEPEAWLKSLVLWRESVDLTEPKVPELLAERLFELAKTSFKLYNDSDGGTSAHVSEAAECLARAAGITSNVQFGSELLFARANMLYTRFVEETNSEDFDESLDSGDKACQLARQVPGLIQQNPFWAGFYAHGFRLSRRIQENKAGNPARNMGLIQALIATFKSIVPFPHPNRSHALNHLGRGYTLLYHTQVRAGQSPTQCISSLETAAEYHHAAFKDTPQGDVTALHPRYTFLGIVNYELSRILELGDTTRAQYLELAIDYFRRANYSTRNLSSFRNLATALEDRYRLLDQSKDLDECVLLLQTQNTSRGQRLIGHPKQFFNAATQLVRVCREHHVSSQILPSYRLLFKALRRLSHMGLTSARRRQALAENSVGHACDAAATALELNDPEAAVELLEDGRSLFYSQLLPMHTDTDSIRALDPKLAENLEYTLEKVRKYSVATEASDYEPSQYYSEGGFAEDIDQDPMDISPQSRELRRYARLLETYIEEVQTLPGHSDFMHPKPFSRLKGAAQYCPVVYVNISRYRCDAIILNSSNHPSPITVTPLPISWSKTHELSRTMQTAIRLQGREVRDSNPDSVRHFVRASRTKQSPTAIVRDVLKQLWECIVRPVLLTLGFLNGLSRSPEELSHVCWCPAGPAATSLPLHAAGNYDLGPEQWATTHIISSYTPTLSSLLQALGRDLDSDSAPRATRVLLVSQPATPPSKPLACVNEERDGVIAALHQSKHSDRTEATVLHDLAGRVADVKSMLPTHELLHLACHGKQDKNDPLESAILLFDGNLTLREIIKSPLPLAELVYLSACQTAAGDIDSPDESLSLAGGFLFSGYRGAVATMWSTNDKDGADVAKAFYKYLMEQDGPLAMGAALALHCAIRDLKAANPSINLIRWIPFMCWGVTRGSR
ncbi:hypothetical protein FRC08_014267 [Ceratobasidium sp. 394]|nr:hypothetical protein FRC08_014267 [Ceratobasidium sp. 394]